MVHHRLHNSPTHVTVLKQINSVNVFTSCLIKIYFNRTLPSTPGSSIRLLSFTMPHQNPDCISFLPQACCMPRLSHCPRSDNTNNIWREVQLRPHFTMHQCPHIPLSEHPRRIFFDISTLEDKDTTMPRKVEIRLPETRRHIPEERHPQMYCYKNEKFGAQNSFPFAVRSTCLQTHRKAAISTKLLNKTNNYLASTLVIPFQPFCHSKYRHRYNCPLSSP